VLVVGKQVLTLDLLSFQTTPLVPLLTPRDWVGVAQMSKAVFAFGGSVDYSGPRTVCEKSTIPPTSWTPLPPMHYARVHFTPCLFKGRFYLASASDHRAVESFSPLTETFTVLPVALPEDLLLVCGSVAFVTDGELILLTYNQQMARWKVESEVCFRISATDRKCWSLCSPLTVGTEVYIANGSMVEKWSLEAHNFVHTPKPCALQ